MGVEADLSGFSPARPFDRGIDVRLADGAQDQPHTLSQRLTSDKASDSTLSNKAVRENAPGTAFPACRAKVRRNPRLVQIGFIGAAADMRAYNPTARQAGDRPARSRI